MDDADDDALVHRARHRGDDAAFAELVRRHQGMLRSAMLRLTRDPVTADELAQDAFIRAWDRLHQYQAGRSFRAWLGGIAYREFLQHLRRERRRQRATDELAHDAGDPPTMSAEIGIDLDRALARLGTDERTAVVLAYGLGMTHGEVSHAMNAPLGTAKSWITRGRAKLQTLLGESEARDSTYDDA